MICISYRPLIIVMTMLYIPLRYLFLTPFAWQDFESYSPGLQAIIKRWRIVNLMDSELSRTDHENEEVAKQVMELVDGDHGLHARSAQRI